MNGFNGPEPAFDASALRQRLRAARRLLIALLLICAAGHAVSWTMAERYLRPACATAAAERGWQNMGYRLPGLGRARNGRRSHCILQDRERSEHLVSANRLVLYGFLFDPWLMSFMVGLPGLLLFLRYTRNRG